LPSIRNAGTDRARLLGAAEDPSVYHIAHDDFGRRTRLATSLHSAHPALNSSIFRLVAIGLCSPHSTMPSSLHFGMSSRPSTAIHATSPAQGPLFFFSGNATHKAAESRIKTDGFASSPHTMRCQPSLGLPGPEWAPVRPRHDTPARVAFPAASVSLTPRSRYISRAGLVSQRSNQAHALFVIRLVRTVVRMGRAIIWQTMSARCHNRRDSRNKVRATLLTQSLR
jgi:hypothetical protein